MDRYCLGDDFAAEVAVDAGKIYITIDALTGAVLTLTWTDRGRTTHIIVAVTSPTAVAVDADGKTIVTTATRTAAKVRRRSPPA